MSRVMAEVVSQSAPFATDSLGMQIVNSILLTLYSILDPENCS